MPYNSFQNLYQHIKATDPRMFDAMNKINDYFVTITRILDAGSSELGTLVQTYKQLNIPRGLGGTEKGLLIRVDSPYNHLLIWNADKWIFADEGSNYIALFRAAPTGPGWQLCDGSNIDFLNSDGSKSGLFNIDNLTTNPAFLKAAAAYTGVINPAAPVTITGTTGTGFAILGGSNSNPATTANLGAALVLPSAGHSHPDSGHTHGVGTLAGTPTGDPVANLLLLPYFRR